MTYEYNNAASCELRLVNDALATIEEMSSTSADDSIKPFDIVFVDADKTRLIDYCDILLRDNRILKRGGLIVVDNVLWKGLVLDVSGSGSESELDDEHSSGSESQYSKSHMDVVRKNKRARKLANKMHRFNR